MKEIKRSLSLLAEEERKKAVESIISFFLDERNEEIGMVAATGMLDFFEREIGPKIYNKAINDSRTALKEEMEELDYKLSEIRK